jgi:hypothetical protein
MDSIVDQDQEAFREQTAAVEDDIAQSSAILAVLVAPGYAAHLLRNLADELDGILITKQ